tara:strand:+ start:5844 stop:6350 length:507 start_codon:yes stop_codon:yes gene_type:complete
MPKTSNKNSSNFVKYRDEFDANNLSGEWINNIYVVKSYGYYPIFIYSAGQWYENENRYSRSTAKQMTQCSYGIRAEAIKKDNQFMQDLMNGKGEKSTKTDALAGMKAFLILGDLMNDKKESQEDKLKYKERIVFATMKSQIPDWQKPSDWDSLPTEEKMKRLNKLQTI